MMKLPFICAAAALLFASFAIAAPELSRYRSLTERNLFKPLWKSAQPSPQDLEAERKMASETARAEQQKQLEELRHQEDARQQDSKKREIESALSLTGIVNDGQNTLAFIKNKSNNDKTLSLQQGETVADCTIVSINSASGTVTLDYQKKFQITLNLNGN